VPWNTIHESEQPLGARLPFVIWTFIENVTFRNIALTDLAQTTRFDEYLTQPTRPAAHNDRAIFQTKAQAKVDAKDQFNKSDLAIVVRKCVDDSGKVCAL